MRLVTFLFSDSLAPIAFTLQMNQNFQFKAFQSDRARQIATLRQSATAS